MDEKILVEARKVLPACDYIVDLFDLSMVWASDKALKLTGYTHPEIRKMRNLDFADQRYDRDRLRSELSERIARSTGQQEYVLVGKNNRRFHAQYVYQTFTYNNGWYLAGKFVKTELMED